MRYALTFVALASPMLLSAQLPQVLPGTRVRVSTATETYTGTFMSQAADTIDVAESGAIHRRIPVSAVRQLFVSQGKTAGAGAIRGLKIGALVLAAVAGLLAVVIWSETGFQAAEGALLVGGGAVEGAMFGAIIGAIVGAEGWQRIY